MDAHLIYIYIYILDIKSYTNSVFLTKESESQ